MCPGSLGSSGIYGKDIGSPGGWSVRKQRFSSTEKVEIAAGAAQSNEAGESQRIGKFELAPEPAWTVRTLERKYPQSEDRLCDDHCAGISQAAQGKGRKRKQRHTAKVTPVEYPTQPANYTLDDQQ